MANEMSRMLKEAQKLEKRMTEVREELAAKRVEGTAGGGAVRVTMNGHHEVISIKIAPEVLEGSDAEMLEDVLLSAMGDAKHKSDELAATELAKVTGGLMPPGLG
jgi:DNA-binding YbaB/EbfC family protein